MAGFWSRIWGNRTADAPKRPEATAPRKGPELDLDGNLLAGTDPLLTGRWADLELATEGDAVAFMALSEAGKEDLLRQLEANGRERPSRDETGQDWTRNRAGRSTRDLPVPEGPELDPAGNLLAGKD